MTQMRMVLSGPGEGIGSVHRALSTAGYTVSVDSEGQPRQKDHHFVIADDGETFITVEGEDLDRAHEVAQSQGWRLRAHWNAPESRSDLAIGTPLERLAWLEGELQRLRRVL